MNTGQSMITIFAMVLLATTIVTVNRGYLTTGVTINQNRINILSISLATSIIEDATSLYFDEKCKDSALTVTPSLTSRNLLGKDGTEDPAKPDQFDDFDDYNCYRSTPKSDTISVPGSSRKVILNTYCAVDYVDENNPNTVSANPTWHKRLKLKVFRPGMKNLAENTDTIKMSVVYSYWFFK